MLGIPEPVFQLIQVDRLDDVVMEAGGERCIEIVVAGCCNEPGRGECRDFAKLFKCLEARNVGQTKIE